MAWTANRDRPHGCCPSRSELEESPTCGEGAITRRAQAQPDRASGFDDERDRSLAAKDYFTKRNNLPELPFSRQQFGGSIGGPIMRNRAFFFGAIERVQEDKSLAVPTRNYNELQLLVPFGALPATSIDQPFRDLLSTLKGNLQLRPDHSLIVRFAHEKNSLENGSKTQAKDACLL